MNALVRARSEAAALLQWLQHAPATQDPTWDRLVQTLREKAELLLTVGDEAVRVAVLGDINSTKTTFVLALIGAGLLPIEEDSTTGNMTVLRLRPAAPGQPTRVGRVVIHFLSTAERRDCLRFMLAETRAQAEARLEAEHVAELVKLVVAAPGPHAIREWVEHVWSRSTALSPESLLPYSLMELHRFCTAWMVAGEPVQPHEVTSADAKQFKAWIQLPKSPTVGLVLPPFPPLPAKLPADPAVWSAADWQEAFAVIGRVEVDVEMSRNRWLLDDGGGVSRFDLCDFPGRGALHSGLRDKFLCVRELKRAHVRIVLCNGRAPNGRAIRDLLEAVRADAGVPPTQGTIVLVGRFDDLPISGDGGRERFSELAADPGVHDTRVLSTFPAFDRVYQDAMALTGHEPNCVGVISPMLAVSRAVGSDPILVEKHRAIPPQIVAFQNALRPLADLLSNPGSQSHLGQWLQAYVHDGGMERTKRMIVGQVRSSGVRALERRAERLLEEVAGLKAKVLERGPAQAPPPASTREVQAALRAVNARLRQVCDQLERQALTLFDGGDGVSVVQRLEKDWHDTVMAWPCWYSLREAVNPRTCVIEPPKPAASSILPPDPTKAAPLPTESDQFQEQFRKSMEEFEGRLAGLVRVGVEGCVRSLLAPLADPLALIGERIAGGRAARHLSGFVPGDRTTTPHPADRLTMLTFLVGMDRPEQFAGPVTAAAMARCGAAVKLDADSLYPLPRRDHASARPLLFGWSEVARRYGPPAGRSHAILINLLSLEFVRTGMLGIDQAIGELEKHLRQVLLENLRDVARRLRGVADCQPLVAALTADSPAAADPAADWLASATAAPDLR